MFQKMVTLLIFSFSLSALADYNGSISFSKSEVDYHRLTIDQFTQAAASCLYDYRDEHISFYNSNCRVVNGRRVCLSKFYGERRYSKKRGAVRADGKPLEYLGDALVRAGFPASYMNEMENTSCVGMTLECLKVAFYETNQVDQWRKVLNYTKANGVGGTALQDALSHLGWKTYYWNPATQDSIISDMQRWDREEAGWQSKGHHFYRYQKVMNNGTYWFNKVDNATDLVGFGRGEPEILKSVPFWVGTAHTGYHVFPGTYGDVVEAHSTRHITAEDNLEFSRFSPFATGGGPRWSSSEKYRSGLIVIPPLN